MLALLISATAYSIAPSFHPMTTNAARTTTLLHAAASTEVEVYSTPGCGYCRKAKSLLSRLQVEYDEIDVSESAELRDAMTLRAGAATVPQIFISGEHVGGATELLGEHEDGKLYTRLSAANIAFVEAAVESEAPPPTLDEGPPPPPLDAPGPDGVLNPPMDAAADAGGSGIEGGAGAAALSSELQKRMLRMLDEYLTEDGSRVDYAALRSSAAFDEFRQAVGQLRSLPKEALFQSTSMRARKAFWINLYNALVLHATVAIGAPSDDPKGLGNFFGGFSGAAYHICGDLRFSLDDIEHGILRCNACQVGKDTPLFDDDDPRLAFSLPPPVDPRIHFALNCGAKSCPPIKFYTAYGLDASLDLASRAFLEGDLEVTDTGITCTKLLDWYGSDFGETPLDIVERLMLILPPDAPLYASLQSMLANMIFGGAQPALNFRPYDWGSNEAERKD